MNKNNYKLFVALSLILSFSACIVKSPYFQKVQSIPSASWSNSFRPSFVFNISDTQHNYIPYLIIRHADDYPFSNIWLNIKIHRPGKSSNDTTIRVEKPLADAKGNWLAKGIGNIIEHKISLYSKEMPILNKVGTYTFSIEQIMRKDPLPSVLDIGIRIEKVNK